MTRNSPSQLKLVSERWHSGQGTQAAILACLQDLTRYQQTSNGYLEELARKSNADTQKKIESTISSSLIGLTLLQNLHSVSQVNSLHLQNTHIEQLLNNIRSYPSQFKFRTPSTYKSSLVIVDEEVFCKSIESILLASTDSKRFITSSRRRKQTLVVTLYAIKKHWLTSASQVILSHTKQPTPQHTYTLAELLVSYCLTLLECQNISVKLGEVAGQQRLYIHIPVSQQLNVFDSIGVEE